MRPYFDAFHRPVLRAGVSGPDPVPLADWSPSWATARNVLLQMGFAMYNYGLLVISPHVTIEMEVQYGK